MEYDASGSNSSSKPEGGTRHEQSVDSGAYLFSPLLLASLLLTLKKMVKIFVTSYMAIWASRSKNRFLFFIFDLMLWEYGWKSLSEMYDYIIVKGSKTLSQVWNRLLDLDCSAEPD